MRFIDHWLLVFLYLVVDCGHRNSLANSDSERLLSNSSASTDVNNVTRKIDNAITEGPRPFALILIISLAATLLIGLGITYYVCCTKLEPIRKRKYQAEGKTTTTKKVTKNAPKTKKTKKKKKKEKIKTKKSKKEPKTVANLSDKKSTVPRSALGEKTKSKAPKSSVGKSTAQASSKSKSGRPVSTQSTVGAPSQLNEATIEKAQSSAAPPVKRNIMGKNVSEVRSLGTVSCTLSKESPVSKAAAVANSTVGNQKVTAKNFDCAKRSLVKSNKPRRDQKDGGKKSKKQ